MMSLDQLDSMTDLALEKLSLAPDSIAPYVLAEDPEGVAEAVVLALMRRFGGVLLAVPPSFFPEDPLQQGNFGEEEAVFGPSITIEVPGVVADGGIIFKNRNFSGGGHHRLSCFSGWTDEIPGWNRGGFAPFRRGRPYIAQ